MLPTFPHALAPSFLTLLARLTMTPIARLEGVRVPTREPYTPGSHDRRDSQTGSGRVRATPRDDRARPALLNPQQKPWKSRLSKPYRPRLCSANVLATPRQSSPVHTARTHWETASVSARLVSSPCSMFTFMCNARVHVHVGGSCRVKSAEVNGLAVNPRWDGTSIGMHCAAVSTHLRQDRTALDERRQSRSSIINNNSKPYRRRPPCRPQTLPVPEVAMPPPAWGAEASEHKANLMPSALRNPPGGDSSTRHTLYDPCHPR